jgi:GNAT superfamily N-acetyltransferase
MHQVRKATAADVGPVARAMALAFEDDPLIDFMVPEKRRLQRLERMFATDIRASYLAHDEVWTTADLQGAALWAPPEKWRRPPQVMIRTAPVMLRALGVRVRSAFAALSVIERNHPPGPHYYLGGLGTAPAAQGTGVGSAVLAPVIERCDREGIGAYLESSKERNLAFYARHGFEVTREIRLPRGGPPLWLMWREPR